MRDISELCIEDVKDDDKIFWDHRHDLINNKYNFSFE